MSDGWAVRWLRRWAEVYTRGLPADVRERRREEIDDDLWSQLEEARLVGRSHRSTNGEILVRWLTGLPADVSWRLARGRAAPAPAPTVPGLSPVSQAPAWLAIVGGLSIVLYGLLIVAIALVTPGFGIEDAYREVTPGLFVILLGAGGIFGIAFATAGFVVQFQERMHPVVAIGGSVAAMIGLFGAFGGVIVWMLWLASAFVVWNLAIAGVIGRRMATAHVVSAALLMATIGLVLLDTRFVALVIFIFPYAITFVAIGVSIRRGVPAGEPARRA
jgi:hypothetical protein